MRLLGHDVREGSVVRLRILGQQLGSRQVRLLICGVVILVVLMVWMVLSIGRSLTYYVTINELHAQGSSLRRTRVSGIVVGESIRWHPETQELAFDLVNSAGEKRLAVRYNGRRPDMFRDGAEAVVEGRYLVDGYFEADRLLLRCPSKYQEKAGG